MKTLAERHENTGALFKRGILVFAEWGGGGVEGADGENFVGFKVRLSVRNHGDRAWGHFLKFLGKAFSRARRPTL